MSHPQLYAGAPSVSSLGFGAPASRVHGAISKLPRRYARDGLKAGLYLALGLFCVCAQDAFAQARWVKRYQARIVATQVNQPHWATPLVTTNARIEQGIRTDFLRQTGSSGQTSWNYGGGHGLQVIPFPRTELRISFPPYLTHSDPKVRGGFGDVAFRLKSRLYGSNEGQHNGIVSVLLGASYPSGDGSCCAILTPTLEVGKGFGSLALTTSLGGVLPLSNTAHLGRSIVLNQAIQYRVTKLIWVETEFNATFFHGGTNDGRQQLFVTPGIVVSRIPLIRGTASAPSPLALTLGVGEQTALTHFNTYNHAPIFSARIRF